MYTRTHIMRQKERSHIIYDMEPSTLTHYPVMQSVGVYMYYIIDTRCIELCLIMELSILRMLLKC